MTLDDQIRQINNQQEFVDICNTVFTEKYGDFQIIDGSRADQGNDGYVPSERRIFAIYCPLKPENKNDKDFLTKIKSDLQKAQRLHESKVYDIQKWTFVTPGKLSNEVIAELMKCASASGFQGGHVEATLLANELYKSPHLIDKFPRLQILKINNKLEEALSELKKFSNEKPPEDVSSLKKNQPDSEDFIKVHKILSQDQSATSKQELRSIIYSTTDKYAQINGILGLIKWYEPVDDNIDDMINWCDQGIQIARILDNGCMLAQFLSTKAVYLSDKWSRIDVETAFSIKMGNAVGLNLLPEQEIQNILERLRLLEDEFNASFKEALETARKEKNLFILANVFSNIGTAAGGRYIHINALGLSERASNEKKLSKKALLYSKDCYSAAGYELGVGYALNNLALQLSNFGEKPEAIDLNEKALNIAKKYNDKSLIQTVLWLQESLKTGRIPDYVHGERRERKV